MPGSVDDLGAPLHTVTFCVVDLETTGGSAAADTITEVGAATFRGGERLGTFQTLVNPGSSVPPEITALTGLTDAMLRPAPSVGQVLPSFLEFARGSVLVGHNLRFDTSFLDAALATTGRSLLDQLRVDTVPLARRLLGDDVRDCKLGTLAATLGLDHRPTHRALDDVLATADLLHLLLERAAAFGVTALDDLLALPGLARHPHVGKLRLTVRLPRSPGAYLVRNRVGEPLHAAAAGDVRTRLRSYFSADPDVPDDDRRLVGPLLREAHSVEHLACGSGLEAVVAASRLAGLLTPRHDRRPGPAAHRWVTLVARPVPRLAITRALRGGELAVLGPVASTSVGRQVVAAIEAAASPGVDAPASGSDTGARVGGPGAAGLDLGLVMAGFGAGLVSRLLDQADASAAAGRYAAAAGYRRHAATLAAELRAHRRRAQLRRAGRVVVGLPGGGRAELVRGCLVRAWHADRSSVMWAPDPTGPPGGDLDRPPRRAALGDVPLDRAEPPPPDGPLTAEAATELGIVGAWLDAHADQVRLLHVEGELSSPLPGIPAVHAAGDEDVTIAERRPVSPIDRDPGTAPAESPDGRGDIVVGVHAGDDDLDRSRTGQPLVAMTAGAAG